IHPLLRVFCLLFLSACHCCWDQPGKRPSWSSVQAVACMSALRHAVSDSRGLLLAPSPADSTWGFFSQFALRVFLSDRFSVPGFRGTVRKRNTNANLLNKNLTRQHKQGKLSAPPQSSFVSALSLSPAQR
ncbi:mCG1028747, partial [Mus musculus]